MTGTKICHNCNKALPTTEFHKNSAKKDGLQTQCKKCMSKRHKAFYQAHINDYKIKSKKYYKKNKGHINKKSREWYRAHIEHVKKTQHIYRQNHKQEHNEWKFQWRKKPENKAKIAGYARKLRQNPVAYEKYRLRKLLRQTMDRQGNNRSALLPPIIGCTTKELYEYLITTWEKNYSRPFSGEQYQIDHILPLSIADDVETVHQLFHYSNLQLLTPKDNRVKHNKINL